MSKIIKIVLFLGGVGTGVAATKTLFKVRYEEILALEIASVKTVYNEKLKEKLTKTFEDEYITVSDNALGDQAVETILNSSGYLAVNDLLTRPLPENEDRNIFEMHGDPDEVDEDEIDPDDVREPIEIVDFTSYDMDYPNYDKLVITYYEADDTLADERGEIMDDISNTVGLDSLTKFGEKSNFRNTVHVRNHNLSADYEISRVAGAYSEEILGVPRMRMGPRKYKLRESDE